jgi:LysR family glycine cleavage system transcriptional activator
MIPDWRTLPSLSALRAFDATARHGGFTGAGRALNVTHVAVAQQVRALERDLGQPLVQRLGRAVSLTEAGDRLARVLNDGFSTIAQGVADLRRSERQRGLRVATTVFTAQSVILPRLPEFWALHPAIEVAMTPGLESVDVLKDGYDLAIRGGAVPRPGTEVIPLARSRHMVVGAPSLLGDGKADPQVLPWIVSPGNDFDREVMQLAGLDPDRLITVNVGSPHLEVQAMLAGLGLGISTELIIRGDLAAGRLREVPFPDLPNMVYSAVVPRAPRRAAIDQFVNWLKTIF